MQMGGKKSGYYDQDPADAFEIADKIQKRYFKEVEKVERKFDVDYKTIHVYFENIFHPLEFGNDEMLPDYRTYVEF